MSNKIQTTSWSDTEIKFNCPKCKRAQVLKKVSFDEYILNDDDFDTFSIDQKGLIWPWYVCHHKNSNDKYCDFEEQILLVPPKTKAQD